MFYKVWITSVCVPLFKMVYVKLQCDTVYYCHFNQISGADVIFVASVICPKCARYSPVFDPLDLRWRCQVMFVSQSDQLRQGHHTVENRYIHIFVPSTSWITHPLGYERVCLPLGNVANTPFHSQGGEVYKNTIYSPGVGLYTVMLARQYINFVKKRKCTLFYQSINLCHTVDAYEHQRLLKG